MKKGNKKMYVTKPISKIEVLVAERLAIDPFLQENKSLPFPARAIRKIKTDLRAMSDEDQLILIFTE